MAKKKNIVSEPEWGAKPPEGMFFGLTLNEGQQIFKEAIMSEDKQVVIANAVAGSGKTLIATACARMLQLYHGYDGVVYVFSANQESALGYRPGTTEEKVGDYLEPLENAIVKLNEEPDKAIVNDDNIKLGTAWVEARPSTFLRGVNFNHKVVIVDECQNFTAPESKKIISRCDEQCKVIIIGCSAQIDIDPNKSCFERLIEYLGQYDFVKVCHLPISYRGRLAQIADKFY